MLTSGQFFSVCGLFCGQQKRAKIKVSEIVLEYKKIQLFPQKKLDLVELLPRFELGTSSLPINKMLL